MTKETIKLDYPILVDGIETDTLTMRRCLVKDIKGMDRITGDVGKSIYLMSELCGISPEAVESMDAADYFRLSEKVAGFLPSSGQSSVL